MEGYFHMRRGTNECGIEQTPAAGLPLLPPVEPASDSGHDVGGEDKATEEENQLFEQWWEFDRDALKPGIVLSA